MEIFLLTLGIFAALMGGMAVGVIFSNKPLRGSCGGVGTSCACEEAGTPGACKVEDSTAAELDPSFNPAGGPADPSNYPDLDLRFKAPGELMQLRKG
ncbi:MAG: hypothetical protein R6X02_28700 [Enhygromyxa sp.]